MGKVAIGVFLLFWSMFISADILIKDVRLIDGTGAPAIENTSIWIQDGLIREIGPGLNTGTSSRIIDGKGMTIIPGLIDCHVHLFSVPGAPFRNDSIEERRSMHKMHLRSYLANGVTTVLDTGIPFEDLTEVRQWLSEGEPGPNVVALGPILSAPGGYTDDRPESVAMHFNVTNTDSVSTRIDQLLAHDVDGIKVVIESGFGPLDVWPIHSPEVREAIVNTAVEKNLPLYVHSMSEPEHHIALDMNPHALVHAGFFEGEPSKELIGRMKDSSAYVISTISVVDAGRVYSQPELLEAPHVKLTVPEAELNTVADIASLVGLSNEMARVSYPDWFPEWLSVWLWDLFQPQVTPLAMLRAVGQMHDAGIPIAMGSDSGNWEVIPFEFHGPTSVREVELLHLAGMTTMEAIKASTSVPAQMLGLKGKVGTIAVGARADLVILPDDPLTDLSVLSRPSSIMKDGVLRTPREWMGYE